MKYIKIYEDKFLDDILDKINIAGIDNLSDLEKEYLNKYDKPDHNKIKTALLKSQEENKLNTLFHNINLTDIDDFENDIKKYWYSLDKKDMKDFIDSNELDDDIINNEWEDLTKDIQEQFQVFLFELGIIEDMKDLDNDFLGEMFWKDLNYKMMDNFLSINSFNNEISLKKWNDLNPDIKNKFLSFLKINGLIV